MSLITECKACGHQSFIITPQDIHITKVLCSKCKHKNNTCEIQEDKLPPVQEKLEYSPHTMLRLIANEILKIKDASSGISLAKVAQAIFPHIDWHTKRYEKGSVHGWNKK